MKLASKMKFIYFLNFYRLQLIRPNILNMIKVNNVRSEIEWSK